MLLMRIGCNLLNPLSENDILQSDSSEQELVYILDMLEYGREVKTSEQQESFPKCSRSMFRRNHHNLK